MLIILSKNTQYNEHSPHGKIFKVRSRLNCVHARVPYEDDCGGGRGGCSCVLVPYQTSANVAEEPTLAYWSRAKIRRSWKKWLWPRAAPYQTKSIVADLRGRRPNECVCAKNCMG